MKHGLSDLQLLGIRLHNFHQPNSNDPIWLVGSAFFSGRREPRYEQAALNRLEPLMSSPNFKQREVLAVMNDLRRVMKQPAKENEHGPDQEVEQQA